MAGFSFRRSAGQLVCDGVPLADDRAGGRHAGARLQRALIGERYRALDAAFAGHPHRLHYAIKANATLAVVRALRALGAGADANSGGEIEVALRAGFAPDEIVFTGVGKTRDELERAIGLGVAAINAESPGEVDRIADHRRGAQGTVARVAVRINPDVDAGSHPHISTGQRVDQVRHVGRATPRAMIRDMAARGRSCRSSVCTCTSDRRSPDRAARRARRRSIADLARALAAEGIQLEHLDLGGGLGIAYEPGQTVRRRRGLRARRPARDRAHRA